MIYGRNKTNFPKRDENWQFYFSFGSLKFDCLGCKTAKLQKKKKKNVDAANKPVMKDGKGML